MIKLLLALIVSFSIGCSHRVYDNGKPAIISYSNTNGKETYESKTLKYTYEGKQNNSGPTRAAGGIVATVGSDLVAGFVPGSGVAPVIGRAAAVSVPHLKPTDTTTP